MSIEKLLWQTDATGLAELMQKGEVTSLELTDAAIERAEKTNGKINAIVEKLYDAARSKAASVETDAPFAGVPIAIKDLNISIAGVATHSGSHVPPFVPEYNSTLVDRFTTAGFIPVFTTTTPEYGVKLVTESERFGITRNPWNTHHVTGGSSGGAAAVVAAGIVPVAHASDGGGSIRVPSACNGLVGMKPSRGRVPLTPDASEGWNGFVMQHAVTRSVRDSAAMLDLVTAHDPISPYAARAPMGSFADAAKRRTKGFNIGVYRNSPLSLQVSPETYEAMDNAVTAAREAGHNVTEIELPMLNRDLFADFGKIVGSSFAGAMRMEAERCGHTVVDKLERPTRILARFGEMISGGEASAALQRLQATSREILKTTNHLDAVFMPLIAHPPVECGAMNPTGADLISEKAVDRLRLSRLLKIRAFLDRLIDQSLWFTHWPVIQNITGQPSIALPVHVTAEGLPIGIQAAGRIGDEETLYTLAGQMEEISGWLDRRAPLDIPA